MKSRSLARQLAVGVALCVLTAWQASAIIALNYPSNLYGNQGGVNVR